MRVRTVAFAMLLATVALAAPVVAQQKPLRDPDVIFVPAAAKEFNARSVGIDINPVRVKEANERVAKAGVTDKVKILNEDLFEANIGEATVVTLYLLQSLNEKLIPKLNKDLKPGTRIVSQTFSMGDKYPPEKTQEVAGRSIYLWTVPMKAK
jgi:cyclopropane fatty-acyl-phospholipid synthase-like methyltransferase